MVLWVCVLFRSNDPSHSTADFLAPLRKTKFDENGNPELNPAIAKSWLRRDTLGPAIGVSSAKGRFVRPAAVERVNRKWELWARGRHSAGGPCATSVAVRW